MLVLATVITRVQDQADASVRALKSKHAADLQAALGRCIELIMLPRPDHTMRWREWCVVVIENTERSFHRDHEDWLKRIAAAHEHDKVTHPCRHSSRVVCWGLIFQCVAVRRPRLCHLCSQSWTLCENEQSLN